MHVYPAGEYVPKAVSELTTALRQTRFLLIFLLNCLPSKAQTNTPLFHAIEKGDLPALQRMEKKGINLNAVDQNGANALMWAVYYGDLIVVKELVHHGAKPGGPAAFYFKTGFISLYGSGYYGSLQSMAAGMGKLAVLRYLADSLHLPLDEMEFDPFVRKKAGWTPLYCAVYYGQTDVVKYLLEKLGYRTRTSIPGLVPVLLLAFKSGHDDIFELLMKAGAEKELGEQATYFRNAAAKAEKEYLGKTGDPDGLKRRLEQLNKQKPDPRKLRLLPQYTVDLAKLHFGPTHPVYAANLAELALYYLDAGKYEQALPLYEEAVAIPKGTAEADEIAYAINLSNLAAAYQFAHQYEKAIPVLQQALSIQKKACGEQNIFYAACLSNLAGAYSHTIQYAQAVPLAQQALTIIQNALGKEHTLYFNGVHELINWYQKTGQHEQSLFLLQQEVAYRKTIQDKTPAQFITDLSSLPGLFHRMNQYRKGIPPPPQDSSNWNEQTDPGDSITRSGQTDYLNSLFNLFSFYNTMGRFHEALPLFLEVLAIAKKIYGKDHIIYATHLSELSTLYMRMGRYEKALPLAQQALTITTNALGTEDPLCATIMNGLAELHIRIGQYDQALPLLQHALAIRKNDRGEVHTQYAINLSSLARLFELMGQYDKALPLFQQALDIFKRVSREDSPLYSFGLNNLAQINTRMGQYEKALPLLQQATSINKKLFGEDHPDYATNLENQASLFSYLGRYHEALPLFEQALAIKKRLLGENHLDYTSLLFEIGWMYNMQGRHAAAAAYFTTSDSLTLSILTHTYTSLSEKEKMEFLNKHAFEFALLPSLLIQHESVPLSAFNQVYANELASKGMVLQDQQTVMNSIHHSGDTGLTRLYQHWTESMNLIGKQLLLPVNKRMAGLNNLQGATNQLEQELSRQAVGFRNAVSSQAITPHAIAQKLSAGQAAVEFIRFQLCRGRWTDSTLYAALLLLPGDSVCKFVPLCEERLLKSLVSRASAIRTSGPLNDSLYNLVWQPLEKYLANVNTVYYAPTGLLHRIAFQSLHTDSTRLLINKYRLCQLLSTRSVALPADDASSKPATAAVWGNIDYGTENSRAIAARGLQDAGAQADTISSFKFYNIDTRAARNQGWPLLSGTRQEIDNITRMLRQAGTQVTVNSGQMATEESFKTMSGRSPQVLHVATHGFFFPVVENKTTRLDLVSGWEAFTAQQNPLFRSGLILAGGNHTWRGEPIAAGKEDGILTAYEIAQMDLSSTDLVVLSACETALGDLQGNEGVFGLQRAFKLAGVKQLIISLWKVPDAETTELMTLFYRNWLGGQTTREALRSAQLKMEEKYPPEKWAAFVLVE